jgi:hypothetical protein
MASPKTPNCTLFKGGLVLSLDPTVCDHACADVLVAAGYTPSAFEERLPNFTPQPDTARNRERNG